MRAGSTAGTYELLYILIAVLSSKHLQGLLCLIHLYQLSEMPSTSFIPDTHVSDSVLWLTNFQEEKLVFFCHIANSTAVTADEQFSKGSYGGCYLRASREDLRRAAHLFTLQADAELHRCQQEELHKIR